MQKIETLILNRNDLKKQSFNKNIFEINNSDFAIPFGSFAESQLVIFIDYNNSSKVIKNRYQ